MAVITDEPGPARQRPMRADARRNYERLLAEAGRAFAEHGADTSLDDIAKRAGVGNATLYRHFATREALLEAVYRDEIDQLSNLAYASGDGPDTLAALQHWILTAVTRSKVHSGLRGLLVLALRDERDELRSWCRETILTAADYVLTRAQQAGTVRPDLSALSMLQLVNSVVIAAEQSGAGGQAEHLISLVFDGLRTR